MAKFAQRTQTQKQTKTKATTDPCSDNSVIIRAFLFGACHVWLRPEKLTGVSQVAEIAFTALQDVAQAEILAHMADPRVVEHLPLLTGAFDQALLETFLAAKAEGWARDGLGHWAILSDGAYVGWGGFEKEEDGWDFGLVLTAEAFGLGLKITRKALAVARGDARIARVTFLLAPSRRSFGALKRMGARPVGEITHAGQVFRKFEIDTRA